MPPMGRYGFPAPAPGAPTPIHRQKVVTAPHPPFRRLPHTKVTAPPSALDMKLHEHRKQGNKAGSRHRKAVRIAGQAPRLAALNESACALFRPLFSEGGFLERVYGADGNDPLPPYAVRKVYDGALAAMLAAMNKRTTGKTVSQRSSSGSA